MKVDPITFAVIKSGLDSIADDMAYTVVRIARSEIVKDVMDFSAALCAGDGQMVAQAKTIAQHLGAMPEAMAAVLEKFGDDLNDGDAVIMNDPYHGGMHLPDIFMFMPLFFLGKRRAFAVVICHHTDVGGRVPGSNASDSTEIYQEGLRIPPLKLYDRGKLDETLATLIRINVRVPDRVWGNLSAQYAAAQVGKLGFAALGVSPQIATGLSAVNPVSLARLMMAPSGTGAEAALLALAEEDRAAPFRFPATGTHA